MEPGGRQPITSTKRDRSKAVGYADAIAILARGAYEEVLRDVVQGALKAMEEWCSSKALRIQGDKSVALIFTKRYKIRKLRNMKVENLEIPFAEKTKYLGVILDRKLLWRRHLEEKCRKAISTFWQCRGALGAKWGVGLRQMHWIYSAIIVPSLTFASIVWWSRTLLSTACEKLDRVQALFLRGITATRRSTPCGAMRNMLNLPSLPLYIKSVVMHTVRLRRYVENGQQEA